MTRYCQAGLPKEDAEDGWHWCRYLSDHSGDHRSREDETAWRDYDTVEVTTVEEVMAVRDHAHEFTGGEDTCYAEPRCPMTWGEYLMRRKEESHG